MAKIQKIQQWPLWGLMKTLFSSKDAFMIEPGDFSCLDFILKNQNQISAYFFLVFYTARVKVSVFKVLICSV